MRKGGVDHETEYDRRKVFGVYRFCNFSSDGHSYFPAPTKFNLQSHQLYRNPCIPRITQHFDLCSDLLLWDKKLRQDALSRMLLLAFTFMLVGMLDALHTISFKGMPFFITQSSVAKATWFWIFARFFNALLMFAILLLPDKKITKDYRGLIIGSAVVITAIIGFIIYRFGNQLPLLMVEGKGTTSLKNGLEYFFSFILFAALIITLYQYHLDRSAAKLAIGLSLVFLLLTELVFTIYQSVYDLDNFTGHVFKVFGFYFILKGLYFSVEEEHHDQEQDTQNFLTELPGVIFKVVKQGEDFITVFSDGELLKELELTKEDFYERPLPEVFLEKDFPIQDYFRLAIKLRETVAFKMPFREKMLLFSLRPLIEEDDSEILIGTISDMTGIHREPPLNQKSRSNFKIVM
jgi:hypothetical protein